ncbi:hypothetical protein DEDE109153_00125 [Deinococcus deserti]|uniref:DUF8082 domain-containing protein n=1 Tax=Deinococcus deserti (strain DSM 17065 / CIP 109153 / LMG 22923 / VCD115) TaxID=546414 RepID=C1CW58_DEIDV|nr:hypothetical protein [Deinococcus deserti]ACO46425.1 hypothetical protein Deide_14720 [Deinococcus deserti VCD115]
MPDVRWPEGLTDQTPLPYGLWKIMTHVDGVRDSVQVARMADVSDADVLAAVQQSQQWIERATAQQRPVSAALEAELTKILVSVVGPMATLMMDDAMEDLGEGATLTAVLSALANELDPSQMDAFVRQVRAKGFL